MDWVVRGGTADWQVLQGAYLIDTRVAPPIFGFSVQYAPGITWEDLVRAGNIPNGQVCYADRKDLEAAVATLGYTMLLIATPGLGFHHELSLALVQNGQMVQHLDEDAAKALSAVFQQHLVRNPLKQP